MSRKKVFIVDDEPMFSELLSDFLASKDKYDTQCFATGEDCVAAIDQHPDIILLDYSLNAKNETAENGLQILERIKKLDKLPKVIILSGQESYGIALQTISKGAISYFIKDKNMFDELSTLLDTFE